MKRLNKKGFTLIEILAVVIILGVLLIIAVPTIGKYVEESRKNTYVTLARNLVDSVATSISAMTLPIIPESEEAVIVPFSEINMEKEISKTKSPYAKYVNDKSYVLVVCQEDKYVYYVAAIDEKGNGFSLTNIEQLTKDKVVDNNIGIYSTTQIKNTKNNGIVEVSVFNMKCLEVVDNIIKVKLCDAVYSAGNTVQLLDGSKYYVIKNSDEKSKVVDVVTYYHMNTDGTQSNSNNTPSFYFNYPQTPDLVYEDSTIYKNVNNIIKGMYNGLVNGGINLKDATIKMPELEDFGCSTTASSCRILNGKGIGQFWMLDIYRHNPNIQFSKYDEVYTFGSLGRGRATTDSSGIGIRMVILNLPKENIDIEATKELKKVR